MTQDPAGCTSTAEIKPSRLTRRHLLAGAVRAGSGAVLGNMALAAFGARADAAAASGRLVVSLVPAEPRTLNGAITTRIGDQLVASQIYNALTRFDAQGRVIPDLATSRTISPDGLTYTYHLSPNVKWQDGTSLTSADVKFTYEQVLIPHHPVGKISFAAVKSIEAPDPHTVVFRLSYKFAPFIENTGPREAMILPKHLYENTDVMTNPHNMQPVGSGPFKLAEWKRGSFVRLTRNEQYFRPGRPRLQEIVFVVVPDASTIVSGMESDQLDYVPFGMPFNLVGKLRGELGPKGWEIGSFNYLYRTIGALFFNVKDPLLAHRDIRQAIAYALDRQTMVRIALAGTSPVADNPIPFYIPNADTPIVYHHDVEKANMLLDKAGYPRKADRMRLSLGLIAYTSYPEMSSLASLARDQLRQAGIAVNIEELDDAAAVQRIYDKGDFQMAFDNPGIGPDPNVSGKIFLSTQIGKGAFTNGMNYANPKVDALYADGAKELDPKKRYAIYKEAVRLIMEDVPMVPLYQEYYVYAYRRKFGGLPPGVSFRDTLEDVTSKS